LSEPLVAEVLHGVLHQGPGVTTTLVLRVYGDHLDHASRRVVVLPESYESCDVVCCCDEYEGFDGFCKADFLDGRGLGAPPLRAVEPVEDRGSEDVLARHKDWLPRKEGQVDYCFEIGRGQRANLMG